MVEKSHWIKEYIDFNTEKRKKECNSFKKAFFKLMNNIVSGISNAKYYQKLVTTLSFVSQKILRKLESC